MGYKGKYEEWLKGKDFDQSTKAELEKIKNNEKEIEDRFYKDLHFGTGGMRGIMGAGTNRMNKYTVGRAIKGLANFILKKEKENPSVVIAHDSRYLSRDFSELAAKILCNEGIKVFLFEDLRPTPELSFAVREKKATSGLVFTASHNTAEYNGFKVYWKDGAQVVSTIADELMEEINKVKGFSMIKDLENQDIKNYPNLYTLGEDIDKKFVDRIKELSINTEARKNFKDLKVVFTPLHGAGNVLVRRVLRELDFEKVFVVQEQAEPDGSFYTVKYPNPEEPESFQLALKLAKRVDGDIIIATDPDCDRLGVMVKTRDNDYIRLTGNQVGVLLTYYIFQNLKKAGKLKEKIFFVDTIVTGKLAQKIAKQYGADTISTLTGFKHIAIAIKHLEDEGGNFIFAFEESYGYLAGDYARDKDGIVSSMLICEMAAYYKGKGMDLHDVLLDIFHIYGYHYEDVFSIILEGRQGAEAIISIMDSLRNNPPEALGGVKVIESIDYLNYESPIGMPKENVLYFKFEDDSWFAIRPSGTEPKIKIYLSVEGEKKIDIEKRLEYLKNDINNLLDRLV